MSGQPVGEVYLQQATDLIAYTHYQLVRKGYPPGFSQSALDRAWGIAKYKTDNLSVQIRGAAFLEVLQVEVGQAETWIKQMQAVLAEP